MVGFWIGATQASEGDMISFMGLDDMPGKTIQLLPIQTLFQD